jgi:heme/copper-type cytochrome/quinol oxidase subunit 2
LFLATAVVMVGSVGPAGAAAENQAYTIRLTVGKSGFEPKRVPVPLGTVHFVVTSRDGDHCFAIPALDVEKRVRASSPLEADVVFERAGEFPFLCCVEGSGTAEVGVIVVAPAR